MTSNILLPETNAFPSILSRGQAEENAEKFFTPHLTKLADIVDYGTHLIPRCIKSSDNGLRETVALIVMLKQFTGFLDASVEMLKKSCVQPCYLTLRGAFEASVYVEFVLGGPRQDRARAFYVWHLRRSRRWALRATRGTPERKSFLADLRQLKINHPFDSTSGQKKAKEERRQIEALLSKSQYRRWNAKFEAIEGKRHFAAWYEPLFRRKRRVTFRDVCSRLRRMHEYRSIYEPCSEEAHSGRLAAHFEVPSSNEMNWIPLRDPSEFGFILKTFSGLAIQTYRVVLNHYRPAENENFSRKYLADWRSLLTQRIVAKPERTIVRF